jgi:hypothetical protein
MKYLSKQFLLILLFTAFALSDVIGQDKVPERKLILSPGLSFQKQVFGEINLMYSKLELSHSGTAIYGPRIGIETNFNPDHFIYAPKIGYEFSGLIFSFRGSTAGYIDNKKLDLRLLPEAGLSLLGAINLTYGYNIPVLDFRTSKISNHKVSLTTNLDWDLWHAL